jgi:hypothetical protein
MKRLSGVEKTASCSKQAVFDVPFCWLAKRDWPAPREEQYEN